MGAAHMETPGGMTNSQEGAMLGRWSHAEAFCSKTLA
jgi:hypothetical protein